ncbi:hypothetical protein [Ruminococcus sp.]|uniref:hypothetical protein n=1 Tax=Ruminococcus sp. TaxID=41978 RepID=UPI0025869D42|nr:hypothetical protein [Ruminococcus sp.]MCR5020068.1 hypothetical protein [Ruminococcus sp.]
MIKKFSASVLALIIMFQCSASISAAPKTYQKGASLTFTWAGSGAHGGQDYHMEAVDNSGNPTIICSNNDGIVNYFSGTKKYIDWKNLGYGIDDDFVCHPRTPDYANEDFLNGLGNFGYFPEFSNYRVPINEVRNSMNEMYATFGDYGTEICTGMPDYDAYYLNGQAMNINNQDFMANQSNGFNHSQQEWTGSKARFMIGEKAYNSLAEMYLDANDEQRRKIEELIEKGLTESDVAPEKVEAVLNWLRTIAELDAEGRIRYFTPVNATYFTEAPDGLSGEEIQQRFIDWCNAHAYDYEALGWNLDDSATWPIGIDIDGTMVLNVGNIEFFNNSVINLTPFDYLRISDRIAWFESLMDVFETAGAETVDVTRVLDRKITTLWIGTSSYDKLYNMYTWTIEKADDEGDGKYTFQPYAGTIGANGDVVGANGQSFSFRPTSEGHYRITCYRNYKPTICNKVAVNFCEYTVLSDIGAIVFFDHDGFMAGNVQRNNYDGEIDSDKIVSTSTKKNPGVETVDGIRRNIDYQEDYTEGELKAHGDVNPDCGMFPSDANSNQAYYLSQYSCVWNFYISDAEVGKTIFDFEDPDNGLRKDFDTERLG